MNSGIIKSLNIDLCTLSDDRQSTSVSEESNPQKNPLRKNVLPQNQRASSLKLVDFAYNFGYSVICHA